jgi:calcium-dependent protein kinase
MRRFASLNAMTRAACGLIAFSLTSEEMEDLEKQFEELDTEQNGALTLHELTTALVDHLNMSPAEAKAVFNRMDQTGDQEIHYSEFLAASLQSRFLLQEKILRDAFNKFDLDNSGHISAENLRTVFGDQYNGTSVEDIIKEVDWKHNGTIDYEEFVQEMMDMVDTKEQDMSKMLNENGTHSSRGSPKNRSRGEFELKIEEDVPTRSHEVGVFNTEPRPGALREGRSRAHTKDSTMSTTSRLTL